MPAVYDPTAEPIEFDTPEGEHYILTELINQPGGDEKGPYMLRARLTTPGGVIHPHFHRSNQWQIVIGGHGHHLGKQPVEPVGLHYTDEYTPYGPIVAGPEGIEFYDMHARKDPEGPFTTALFMPESKEQLIQKAGRNLVFGSDPHDPALVKALKEPQVETIAAPLSDGVAAYRLRCGPSQTGSGPSPKSSAGQFYLCLGGRGQLNGATLTRGTGFFVYPNEEPPQVQASEEGFDTLVLQYPQR